MFNFCIILSGVAYSGKSTLANGLCNIFESKNYNCRTYEADKIEVQLLQLMYSKFLGPWTRYFKIGHYNQIEWKLTKWNKFQAYFRTTFKQQISSFSRKVLYAQIRNQLLQSSISGNFRKKIEATCYSGR